MKSMQIIGKDEEYGFDLYGNKESSPIPESCFEDCWEVLRELELDSWVRPMDVGGCDGSHHSRTLTKLCGLGLAEMRGKFHRGDRGGRRYRLSKAGAEYIKELRASKKVKD